MSDRERLDVIERTIHGNYALREGPVAELIALARKAMDERDRLLAQEAVRGGEWCAENRAAGRNPCGACRWCCAQAERERDEARHLLSGANILLAAADERDSKAQVTRGQYAARALNAEYRAEAAEAELARLRPVVEAAKEKAEDHNEDTGGTCQCVVCRAVAALARAESDEKGGAK